MRTARPGQPSTARSCRQRCGRRAKSDCKCPDPRRYGGRHERADRRAPRPPAAPNTLRPRRQRLRLTERANDPTARMTPRRALLVASIVATVLFAWLGRGLTYYGDEWEWLLATVDVRPEIFLESYNGHLTVPTIALFSAIPAIFGMDEYAALRLAAIPAHLACVWLVFALARRRVGEAGGAVAAMLLLFLGACHGRAARDRVERRDPRCGRRGPFRTVDARAADASRGHRRGGAVGSGAGEPGRGGGVPVLRAGGSGLSPERRRAHARDGGLRWCRIWRGGRSTAKPTRRRPAFGDRLLFFVHLAASGLAGLLGVQLASPRVQDLPGAVTRGEPRGGRRGTRGDVGAGASPAAGVTPAGRAAGGGRVLWATVTLARTGDTDPLQHPLRVPGAVLILLIGVELMQGVRISRRALRRAVAARPRCSLAPSACVVAGGRGVRAPGRRADPARGARGDRARRATG